MPVGWSPVFLGAERVIGAVVGWPWARLVMGQGPYPAGLTADLVLGQP